MKILILGAGGREHALCWKIAQSPLCTELFCSPGNAGIAQIAQCLSGEPVEIARKVGADFVVVGPDGLLAEGVVDKLNGAGFGAFGPTQSAARLESSKVFCKQLLLEHQIPTAKAAFFHHGDEAKSWLRNQREGGFVVKADGLAVGKGVVVAPSREVAIAAIDEVLGIAAATSQGDAGRLLIEEVLTGEEISFFALTDGQNLLPLAEAQDHKRAFDGDLGPNTGGMGCYSPVPIFSLKLREEIIETILKPTLEALKSEGVEYRGVLFCGLMLTTDGPKVIEYNARFGDPETQVLLPRLESDLLPLLLACASVGEEKLSDFKPKWSDEAAVCVVMAAQNYPGTPRKGDVISGLENVQELVFHAGTAEKDGQIVTSGGRVLGVTALGEDFLVAREKCYAQVKKIKFDGAHFRRDIGWRAVFEPK